MILYFSGTGNSAYVAERIARKTGDEIQNLSRKIQNRNYSELKSECPWVLVVPTYAWRIPRMVEQWMLKTKLSGSRELYVVMTCGGDNGNAGAYVKKLCRKKKMEFRGCMAVVMPENYIAMFDAPKKEEALKIIRKSELEIQKAAKYVRERKHFLEPQADWKGRLKSGVVNAVFYPVFVHAKKFKVSDTCISCGKCVGVCPLRNIRMENGKPIWGKNCTHCMACICRCPAEAIEYGKNSVGKVRYVCPK